MARGSGHPFFTDRYDGKVKPLTRPLFKTVPRYPIETPYFQFVKVKSGTLKDLRIKHISEVEPQGQHTAGQDPWKIKRGKDKIVWTYRHKSPQPERRVGFKIELYPEHEFWKVDVYKRHNQHAQRNYVLIQDKTFETAKQALAYVKQEGPQLTKGLPRKTGLQFVKLAQQIRKEPDKVVLKFQE